ncbi:hypothetical protein ACH4FE_28170 [Streptomyces celluloflavus]|uniref:hypothetical protein n=1 Tax=Streptomyces celluloflavus TaxID=58344 RepID=UPI0037B15DE7
MKQETAETSARPSGRQCGGGVPPLNPRFRGRGATLAELEQRVRSDPMGVTVLLGPPGVGKRQIATEYVHRNATRFGPVRWIGAGLAPVGDAPPAAGVRADARDSAMLTVVDGLRSWKELDRYRHAFDGHLLVTATGAAAEWQPWAGVVSVGRWARSTAVGFLRESACWLSTEDAERLAGALGDLPLALAYAGEWLNRRGGNPDDFLDALRWHPHEALGGAGPDGYPGTLAARFERVRGALAENDCWLTRILDAAALLGPAPLPTRAIGPGPLGHSDTSLLGAEIALDTTALFPAFSELAKTGLAALDNGLLYIDPVYCAVVRSLLSLEERQRAAGWAEALLGALVPRGGSGDRLRRELQWRPVLPVFRTCAPDEIRGRDGLSALRAAYGHLIDAGCWHAVLGQLESLYHRARLLQPQTGPLDLDIGDTLLRAYSSAHRYTDAATLGWALYEQRAARCGARNAATLRCASSLIVPLAGTGDFSAAARIFRGTLAAQSDVLGSDDRDTLRTRSRRAVVELMSHRWLDAIKTAEGVLEQQRSVLGPRDRDSLATAYVLGRAYSASPAYAVRALPLLSKTVRTQEEVLGDGHPTTVRTAAAFELAYLGVHGVPHNGEGCRMTLDRLRGEFGVRDSDVNELETHLSQL